MINLKFNNGILVAIIFLIVIIVGLNLLEIKNEQSENEKKLESIPKITYEKKSNEIESQEERIYKNDKGLAGEKKIENEHEILDFTSSDFAEFPLLSQIEFQLENELIQYIYDEEKKLSMEIDRDENSFSYKKPLKKYTYTKNNRISSQTKYEYYTDQTVEIIINIAYKEDGTVMDTKQTILSHAIE